MRWNSTWMNTKYIPLLSIVMEYRLARSLLMSVEKWDCNRFKSHQWVQLACSAAGWWSTRRPLAWSTETCRCAGSRCWPRGLAAPWTLTARLPSSCRVPALWLSCGLFSVEQEENIWSYIRTEVYFCTPTFTNVVSRNLLPSSEYNFKLDWQLGWYW